jgi:1,4-alpha-glucan branching enzyme
MNRVNSKEKIRQKRWTFSLEANDAKEVFLVGDFNNWSLEKHPMRKDKNGAWNKQVMLSTGDHEYKFVVDGQWKEDPRNNRRSPNYFGSYNSIVSLPGA